MQLIAQPKDPEDNKTRTILAKTFNTNRGYVETMIYSCKQCGAEISLSEIDFEGATFCKCGSMEMSYKGTRKDHIPKKKDTLTLMIEGVVSHYKT